VNVDATAASKISYNSTTNTLTLKSSVLTDTATVTRWVNGGAINLQNGAQIQGLYSASGASNKILEINGVADGASLYVGNNATGITTLFQANADQPAYRVYYAPGTTPAQLVARELYGFQRFAQVLTLADGLNVVNLVDIPDIGITEEDLPTVLAYVAIEGPSKFYDRTAAFRLTEQGIKLGQMVTRSGAALEIGNFSHLINKDAMLVYAVVGSLITTKSTAYAADDRYNTQIANPPATIAANSTEVLTINIEDGNGNSQITIAGGRGTYEIWKITTATASANYTTGTKIGDFTTANNKYRFIGDTAPGFDYLTVDLTTTVKDRYPATKGVYVHSLYSGAEIQLAQAPEVIENGVKLDVIKVELAEVRAKTDNLPAAPAAVGDAMTLTGAYDAAKTAATQTSVDGVADAVGALGEPLQAADYTEPATAEAIATQVELQIINEDDGRAVLQAIADKIMAEEISSTVIAQSVRAELATELGRIDAAISTRSTLTAEDIPEGLTAAEVWSADTRTLTESAGLTTEQAAQLANVETLAEALPTLAGIEGSAVLAKAADVDGLPSAADTAAAVLGAAVESGATVAQSLRLANAVLGGKVSGGQTGTETFRNLADTKDVLVSTNDAAGNRTAVVTNLS
jgi:hypothetical protein